MRNEGEEEKAERRRGSNPRYASEVRWRGDEARGQRSRMMAASEGQRDVFTRGRVSLSGGGGRQGGIGGISGRQGKVFAEGGSLARWSSVVPVPPATQPRAER